MFLMLGGGEQMGRGDQGSRKVGLKERDNNKEEERERGGGENLGGITIEQDMVGGKKKIKELNGGLERCKIHARKRR